MGNRSSKKPGMTPRYRGFLNLRTPQDLLAKAKHDVARMRDNPCDTYAAYDFFVTARHIPEWIKECGGAKPDDSFDKYPHLRICRNVGDGAKHFALTDPRHVQVNGTISKPDAFQAGPFQQSTFQACRLIIILSNDEPEIAELGKSIEVLELARRVIGELESIISEYEVSLQRNAKTR